MALEFNRLNNSNGQKAYFNAALLRVFSSLSVISVVILVVISSR